MYKDNLPLRFGCLSRALPLELLFSVFFYKWQDKMAELKACRLRRYSRLSIDKDWVFCGDWVGH